LKGSGEEIAVGEATFHDGGRIDELTLRKAKSSDRCADAMRILLTNYAADVLRPPSGGSRALLVVPYSRDYVQCQNTIPPLPLQQIHDDPPPSGGPIVPPVKVHVVRPIYPPEMRSEHRSGTVIIEAAISGTGCVQDARVVKSVGPEFDAAAMRALLQWRFTPALRGSEPVPVTMAVGIMFALE
jgi:TonB family protein